MHFQEKLPENGRKNIFRDKQTTSKVLLDILRGFKVRKMVRFIFLKVKGQHER